MTFGALTAERTARAVIVAALLAGAALRLTQYFSNPSLWLDEAAVSRNVVERSFDQLLRPLSYGQVAPVGFLLMQKTATLLSTSEYALRLLPLACGLAAMLLFVAVARAALTRAAVPYAALLFALAPPFIYFSSQAKQYASDTAASLLAVWMALMLAHGASRGRLLACAIAGACLPWISTAATLVLGGAALGVLAPLLRRRDWTSTRAILPCLVLWSASAIAAGWTATATVTPQTREFLDWFWRMGYVPRAPVLQLRWYWRTLNEIYGSFGAEAFRTNGGLAYAWPQLFVLTMGIGYVQLARRRPREFMILIGPMAVAVVASLLRLYPLSGRLLLFLVPLLLLATAAGAQAMWTWFADRSRIAGWMVMTVLVAIPAHAAIKTHPPYSIQPVRPVLERLDPLRQPGDVVYVDYGAAQAFLYYAPRFDFQPDEYEISECSLADRRDYLRQVDRFRGRRRVWIVGTHLSAVERVLTVSYLEQIGRRVESVFVPPVGAPLPFAAYARLYDLSDPARLAQANAETFPFRDVPLTDEEKRWGCFGPALPGE